MGFEKRDQAKKYAPQDGDTLAKIAERESKAGNKLTWQEIAKFNWGTDQPAEVNEFLRDELGCYRRDDENGFVISADAKPQGELRIPVRFKKAGLSTAKTHTLKVKRPPPAPPKQFRGCARVKGICFDFDSSFIRPSVVEDLKRLDQELKKHPDGKVMIFGHTDKVGPEQYNKGLSERRARSVFAFITDDADAWEALYNDPDEKSKWGLKVVQTILKDLGHDPGPIDGIMGSKTKAAIQAFDPASSDNTPALRKKLFKAYMTGKHDVALKPEQFMDPKHMGCGEFNPVVDTEAKNEANRRVTFYIFHKDRLPKLPCKTGDLAPCHQQTSQPAPRHFASFRCSFYDSLAKDCPCEVGPVPPEPVPATIEILDASNAVATSVKFGLWDNAFDAAGAVLNAADEPNNFAGADTRRFRIRVTDPAAAGGSVDVDWKTLGSTRADLDTASTTPNLTLVETGAGTKVFESRGLILTTDLHDVQQPTNSGLTAPLPDPGNRNNGQTNHRTRTGSMEGFVKAEYTPAVGAAVSVELPVFERNPDERRRLPIQFYVLRVAAGGAGVVPTAAGSALWTTDMRVIRETYERVGIKFESLVPPGTPAGDVVTVDGISIILATVPAGINPLNITTANETAIGTAFPMVGHTVRVFVTGGLASGNRGEAAPDVDFAGTPDQGTAFIDGPTRGPYTIAHETGHMLTDKSSAVNGGHYNAPAAPAGNRFFNNQNLMRNGTSPAEGVNQSKRLWDAADQDGNNGFTTTRGSPYTRPF